MRLHNNKGSFSMMVLVVLVWLGRYSSSAQERPSLFLEKFDYSTSFRTNVCDRQRAIWNNTAALPQALHGLQLSVVMTNYTFREHWALFHLDRNGRIPNERPGLFVVVMDELARRAGFTWRENFGVAEPLIPEEDGLNTTWTDILLWGVESFDISMEKWGYSLERVAKQVSFPAGYWDASVALVEQFRAGDNTRKTISWWQFLLPFHISTWMGIAMASIITGMQFWIMEAYINPSEDWTALESRPFGSLYLAATCFTGHFGFQPHSSSGYTLSISFTFCALTVALAYTANMASFLVSPTVTVYNYPNMGTALSKDATICVQGQGAVHSLLSQQWPMAKFSPQFSEDKIFSELRPGGSCEVAAHQYSAFRTFKRTKSVNYDCSFETNGQYVIQISGGMATKVDNGGAYCTSLISHVLDFHMNEMLLDGFIEKAFENYYQRVGTVECIESRDSVSEPDEPYRLGLKDVGGLFMMHLIMITIALSSAVINYYFFPPILEEGSLSSVEGKHAAAASGTAALLRSSTNSSSRRHIKPRVNFDFWEETEGKLPFRTSQNSSRSRRRVLSSEDFSDTLSDICTSEVSI